MPRHLTRKVTPSRFGAAAPTWIAGISLPVVIGVAGIGGLLWLRHGIDTAPPPAATFSLPASTTGNVISLGEYLGKEPLVLLFYMTAT
jgi:hypothetical protein